MLYGTKEKALNQLIVKDFFYLNFRSPAEREGFEPPEALTSTVFKTAAIDHSAISPKYWSIQSSDF